MDSEAKLQAVTAAVEASPPVGLRSRLARRPSAQAPPRQALRLQNESLKEQLQGAVPPLAAAAGAAAGAVAAAEVRRNEHRSRLPLS